MKAVLRRGLESLRAPLVAIGVLALVSLAGTAEACPVCFQAKNDASRLAFIATTGFMTSLPLLLVGAVVWWLRRQFVESERGERARPAETSGSASGDALPSGRPVASSS